MGKPRAIDMTGQRFGRVVVLERSGTYRYPDYGCQAVWRCRCDCGTVFETLGGNLRGGGTRSCGCLRSERMRAYNIERRKKHEPDSNCES